MPDGVVSTALLSSVRSTYLQSSETQAASYSTVDVVCTAVPDQNAQKAFKHHNNFGEGSV